MSTIYMAGSYPRRLELFQLACELVQAGHTVTSRWLKGNDQLPKQAQIDMDLVDLLAADTVMFFNSPEAGKEFNTGGRHVELGYALAMNDSGDNRRIIVVGWPENLFHYSEDVENYPTFAEAGAALMGTTTASEVMAGARLKAAKL